MKKLIVIVLIILAIFGVLRAIDALAAANPPALGGTGTSIVPSSGQTLIGNTSGTYTPTLLYSLFGATAPLSYNASTGVVSWTNSNGYTTTTIQSVLNVFSATGLATYNSSTGVITVSSSSLALGSASHNSTGDFLASSTAFVSSFNTRTGAVTLSSGDVTSALGYTPYNSTNPSNYATTTIQSVLQSLSAAGLATYNGSTGIFTVSSSSLSLGTASQHPATDFLASSTLFITSFNTRTGAITLASSDVTTALGFTPYSATNPSGFTTTTISSVLKSISGTNPITYNSSTGAVAWVNSNNYITLSALSALGTGLTYNSSTGAFTWTNPGYITSAPATTTFNNITTSTLSIKAGSGVGIASSTDGTGQAIITISATGGSSSTIVTGVSPIVVSQSGVNATTSCPTCITSAVQMLFGLSTSSISITTSTAASTFNVTSTGGNTIKITIPSNVGFFTNDSGYLTGNQSITISGAVSGSGTTAITTVYNTSTLYSFFSASGPIGYNASTGAFSFTNPGYISTSTSLTVSNFASPNISQWTNNSGYITTSTNNFGGLTNGSITAVSPIFWSSTSTISCPTCITTSTFNTTGTPLNFPFWTSGGNALASGSLVSEPTSNNISISTTGGYLSNKLLTITDRSFPASNAGASGLLVDINGGGGIYMTGDSGATQGKFEAYGSALGVGSMSNVPFSLWQNNGERARFTTTTVSGGSDFLLATTSDCGYEVCINGGGLIGALESFGSSTFNGNVKINGVSSTLSIGLSTNPSHGCIEMYDAVNTSTLNYIYVSSGVLTATTTKPVFCN